MNSARRLFLISAALIMITSFGCGPDPNAHLPAEGTVRIVRDTYGVPHIYASTERDMYYGFGYAVAQTRAEDIFRTLLAAQGRSAELNGEESLENDIAVRSFQLAKTAATGWQAQPERMKDIVTAYCAGVNRAIEEQRDELPDWVTRYEPEDLMTVGLMVNLVFPLSTLQREMSQLDQRGSNQFAVAPERSANGHAMLSMDPHLPFDLLNWIEVQISTPEFSAVGCAIPNLPVIVMGHNGSVAWSQTNNRPDVQDIYSFPLEDEEGKTYRSDDGVREFERIEEGFLVRGEDGMEEVRRTLLITHVGPVLKVEDGVAYAARIAGLDVSTMLQQSIDKSAAGTVQEYFEAMHVPGQSMWNHMAADTQGNIGYLWNALLPRRNSELDWSEVVPGDDPRSRWNGYQSFDALPLVLNPASGWLQNCNDSPWHVTQDSGIEQENQPVGMESERFGHRGRRMTELLSTDESVTFEEMIDYATDTLVWEARWWVPRMVEAYSRFADEMSLQDTPTQQAIELLEDWNFRAEADSTAMPLFYIWYTSNNLRGISRDENRLTDDILRKQLIELGSAVTEVENRYGRLDVPWGQIHFLRRGDAEFSLPGGGNYFDVIRQTWGQRTEDKRISVTGGSSYQMVVEMSETPRARSCMPLGISADPADPHFADLTILYSRKQYKPVWYTWEDLQEHIESDVTLDVVMEGAEVTR